MQDDERPLRAPTAQVTATITRQTKHNNTKTATTRTTTIETLNKNNQWNTAKPTATSPFRSLSLSPSLSLLSLSHRPPQPKERLSPRALKQKGGGGGNPRQSNTLHKAAGMDLSERERVCLMLFVLFVAIRWLFLLFVCLTFCSCLLDVSEQAATIHVGERAVFVFALSTCLLFWLTAVSFVRHPRPSCCFIVVVVLLLLSLFHFCYCSPSTRWSCQSYCGLRRNSARLGLLLVVVLSVVICCCLWLIVVICRCCLLCIIRSMLPRIASDAVVCCLWLAVADVVAVVIVVGLVAVVLHVTPVIVIVVIVVVVVCCHSSCSLHPPLGQSASSTGTIPHLNVVVLLLLIVVLLFASFACCCCRCWCCSSHCTSSVSQSCP